MTWVSGNLGKVPLGLIAPHSHPTIGELLPAANHTTISRAGVRQDLRSEEQEGTAVARAQVWGGGRLPRPPIRTLSLVPQGEDSQCPTPDRSLRLPATRKGTCLLLTAVHTGLLPQPLLAGRKEVPGTDLTHGTPKGLRPHRALHTSPVAWLGSVTGRPPRKHRREWVCAARGHFPLSSQTEPRVCFEGNRVSAVSCCSHLQERNDSSSGGRVAWAPDTPLLCCNCSQRLSFGPRCPGRSRDTTQL